MARKKDNRNRDFFDDDMEFSVDDPISEDAIFIDTEDISRKANDDARFMLKDLTKIYGNEKFMAAHPDYKKRLDMELESMRMLLKMRRADEITHDLLVKQIGMNPSNAGMYSALNKLQKSLLDIQTKLDETVKNVNNLLKNYQLEIPFEEDTKEEDADKPRGDSHRGSKAFILEMEKVMSDPMDIFEDDINVVKTAEIFTPEEPKPYA